jgi:hypothetical protein
MKDKIIAPIMLAGGLAFASSANALLISDLDLSALSFETIYAADTNFPTSASGTSNGVGYSVSGTFYAPFSNMTSSQSFNDLPGRYDDIHAGGDFTITFDTPIDALLVALGNDNSTGDGPDFGLTPADSTGITVSGTKLSIVDINGALALLQFASPISSLTHTNDSQTDGFDMAFFAYESDQGNGQVPLPTTLALLGLGLAGFATRKRVRSNK